MGSIFWALTCWYEVLPMLPTSDRYTCTYARVRAREELADVLLVVLEFCLVVSQIPGPGNLL